MPDWRGELRRRLAALRLPPTREAEIVEELSQHLEDRYQELCARGSSEAEASRAVLREAREGRVLAQALAGIERRAAAEAIPPGSGSGDRWLSRVAQDLRFGFRMLRTRPGFTAIAVLTLALGIGANTAIFSVIHAVLLRPLPYPNSDRLVTFWGTAPEKRLPVVAYPDAMMVFFHQRTRVLEKVAGYSSGGMSLVVGDEPERVSTSWVTTDFFSVMGQVPLLGRTFLAEEGTQGRSDVAVLSYGLWQRRFGADRTLIGKPITVAGRPTVVVGVGPAGFDYPDHAELWLPLVLDPEGVNSWYLSTVGRVAPGRRVEEVRREVEAMSDEFMLARPQRFPEAKRGGARAVAKPILADLVGEARTPLLVLLGAVGLVLLIAAANIGNLMLARAVSRTREMAVRCCLGASASRLAGQLLTESLLLATAGATVGLLLAMGSLRAIRGLVAAPIPRLEQVQLDLPTLLFTLGVTATAALLFGLAPAIRASRLDLLEGLREGAREGTSGSSRRLSQGFVVAQLALSLILLIGAGLLLRSFRRTLAVDPGFRPEQVLAARIQLPGAKYPNEAVVRSFYERLLPSVATIPGVREVGLNERVPFSRGNPQENLYVEGQFPKPGEAVPVINVRSVTPGYFAAIGTPILQGRGFLATDDSATTPVVVIDETVARQYWPGGDPIGKRIRTSLDSTAPWWTIVGVAPNVKHRSLREEPNFEAYLPLTQRVRWQTYLVVRSASDPAALAATLRRRVSELDPTLPLSEVHPLKEALAASLSTSRLTNALFTGFAGLALLLAVIGIYGVMALSVNGRFREFGVRLALGAGAPNVLWLVIRQGMVLASLGLALGFAGAAWLSRFLRTLLFGVDPVDPLTYLSVGAVLATAAFLACYLPARRATKADPIAVLRRD